MFYDVKPKDDLSNILLIAQDLEFKDAEAATRGVLWKKVLLEISQNSQESTCARVFFLIKLQDFFGEFCKISKNTFFTEHLRTTASKDILSS